MRDSKYGLSGCLHNDISLKVPAALAILARARHISIRLRDSLYAAFLDTLGTSFNFCV